MHLVETIRLVANGASVIASDCACTNERAPLVTEVIHTKCVAVQLPCSSLTYFIIKKNEPSWFVFSAFGGDNKTRTYDLYDVNVAL